MRNPTVVEVVKVMARQAFKFFTGAVVTCVAAAVVAMGVIGLASLIPGHGMTGGELWAGRGALGVLVLIGGTVWYVSAAEKVKCRKARERRSGLE